MGVIMKIHILASGSKGNATVYKSDETTFMVDCGISLNKIKEKLNKTDLILEEIKEIFITHEHTDHVSGLKQLLKQKTIETVFISSLTLNSLPDEVKELMPNIFIVKADSVYNHKGIIIKTIELSHDAAEPIGYIFNNDTKKIVHITDTGHVDYSYYDELTGADFYYLESNHCTAMLMKSKRPYVLKQRILGNKGHLSNLEATSLMNKLLTKPAIWVVAHISEECNLKLKIEKEIVQNIDDLTLLDVIFTEQDKVEVIEL